MNNSTACAHSHMLFFPYVMCFVQTFIDSRLNLLKVLLIFAQGHFGLGFFYETYFLELNSFFVSFVSVLQFFTIERGEI